MTEALQLIFALVILAAVWWWGSWHGRKYTSKHERVEASAKQLVDRIEMAGGNFPAALDRELAKIQEAADRKADELRAEFHKRFGG